MAMRRFAEVTSPLGPDTLLFRRMVAREELGRLFEFTLDLVSRSERISFEDLLGQRLTVQMELLDGKTRYFNGHVSRFSQVGRVERYTAYQATLRPWLWFLTRTADCRIFQEQSVPEIVKAVFREHGFGDFDEALSGTYPPRDYCVQYRETDFDFVSRLMEQEGIYYYFKHHEQKHVLILSDSYSAHDRISGNDTIPYFPPTEKAVREGGRIFEWSVSKEIQTGVYALNDFDFEKPRANLVVKSPNIRKHAEADHEVYDYPGIYVNTDEGERYARTRIEEVHAQYERVVGKGDARGLAAGGLFELTEYPRADQAREYLIVSATHQLASTEYESASSPEAVPEYECSFSAIESRQPFRSARVTPKPFVQGPQTAIVVGKAGEEIWTDKHGRVKVQFPWDRARKENEGSSCWVRVSHPWAGKGWGSVSIPRIGQEVVVDFLEGDPDRPIITGRVYNTDNMPPYPLPAGAVVSGLKSNTHKGHGSNEMSMDDTAGKEKITIHGQYDMSTTIEHDQTNTVNNKFTETIKSDATIKITEGKYSHDVAANVADYHVQGALTEKYDTTQDTTVKGNITIKSTAGEILIEAANKITLHTGSSKIEMDSGGKISVEGLDVSVKGSTIVAVKGGVVHSEADSQHQTKGAIVLSEGSATNTVKGGMVMLNP